MIPNYRTITLTAGANVNVVPMIYKILKAEGYNTSDFLLDFVAFEADAGTQFKINGNPLKVPSSGAFYTPYCGNENFISINSLSFDEGCNGLDLYIIY